MCRPPRIAVNADERTARRSVPATFVGCAWLVAPVNTRRALWFRIQSHKTDLFLTHFGRIDNNPLNFRGGYCEVLAKWLS